MWLLGFLVVSLTAILICLHMVMRSGCWVHVSFGKYGQPDACFEDFEPEAYPANPYAVIMTTDEANDFVLETGGLSSANLFRGWVEVFPQPNESEIVVGNQGLKIVPEVEPSAFGLVVDEDEEDLCENSLDECDCDDDYDNYFDEDDDDDFDDDEDECHCCCGGRGCNGF